MKAQPEKLAVNQGKENADLKSGNEQLQAKLTGLQRSILMVNRRPAGTHTDSNKFADGIPVDRKTGEVSAPHTVLSLTAEQIDETQTLGVKLPAGAKPTDPVYQSRLRQIAAAADQMGLRHALFPEVDKKREP